MKKRRAFTLIELLVVISIVALLVALLLPALRSARDAAYSVGCLSNMRQLGIGFNTYASDWGDYMPGGNEWWYPGQQQWVGQLGYGGAVGSPITYTTYLGGGDYPGYQSWLVFRDPGEQPYYSGLGDGYYYGAAGNHCNSWNLWYSRSSYALNFDISKNIYGAPRKAWSRGPELVGPTKAALVTDTIANSALFWSHLDTPANSDLQTYNDYAFRHSGLKVVNVLYWDGHAGGRRRYAETGDLIWYRLFSTLPDLTPSTNF